jgi:hypothetical protein
VLEAVVEEVESRPEFLLGKNPSLIAFFSDDYRDAQAPRQEQRFISKTAC